MALDSSRRAQDHCAIFGVDGSDHRFDGGIERSLASKHGSCFVWAFDAPDGGAGRMFSVEDMISDSQRRPASAAVVRMLGQGRVTSQQVRTRRDGFGDDLNAAPFERYFWARNAPYTSTDPCNQLKSQQIRPPSERTINPRLAIFSGEGERQVCGESASECLSPDWKSDLIR
jgi:hypothetical protein